MSKTPGPSDEGEDIVVDIEAPPAGPAEFEDPDDRVEAAAPEGGPPEAVSVEPASAGLAPVELAAAEDSGPESVPEAPLESVPDSAPVEPVSDVPRSRVRLVAFASGRGGTGRSLLAANVAVYLAQAAKKVVAIDADPAGGPLHQLLGAPRPPRGFGEFLRGKASNLNELIVDTPIAGVGLVGGEGSAFGTTRPKQTAKATLAAIAALDVDYVIVDLGPADSTLTLDLWLGADVPVLVTLPEPASVESTYRFAKSAFLRRLRSIRGLDRLVASSNGPPAAALDLYRSVKVAGGPTDKLEQEIRAFRPTFVVNQTRTVQDLKLGTWMASAARRRLGHGLEYLGHVEADETVWLAARRHRSLVAEYPEGKASKNIERLGRKLLSLENERDRVSATVAPLRPEEEQTYYEILETEPGVSDEEVRRAYRSIKDIYASGSLVISGLYEDHELAELHARVNAAHDTLFAPDRRRLYDLALPEADLARAVRAAANAGRRPSAPLPTTEERAETSEMVVDPDAEITGEFLRKIRQSRGIELGDISQRTKISERYLRALEEENFTDMPAAVYIRGYVMEYARALRIDAHRVTERYLARYRKNAAAAPSSSAAT
ncbi:MAG TPA: helix-turn-helix domain-containing protein [Polyangia bacterium]|nr:helix-turn-helix domain-containing protein [Polyangia bacterium]